MCFRLNETLICFGGGRGEGDPFSYNLAYLENKRSQ